MVEEPLARLRQLILDILHQVSVASDEADLSRVVLRNRSRARQVYDLVRRVDATDAEFRSAELLEYQDFDIACDRASISSLLFARVSFGRSQILPAVPPTFGSAGSYCYRSKHCHPLPAM